MFEFEHTASSPYHSQSNGKAESSVKLAKRILMRAADPQLALLETTARMYQRRRQSESCRERKETLQQSCERLTSDKNESTRVFLWDFTYYMQKWIDVQVLKQLTDRSYRVVSQGQVLRRNCKHLLPQAVPVDVYHSTASLQPTTSHSVEVDHPTR